MAKPIAQPQRIATLSIDELLAEQEETNRVNALTREQREGEAKDGKTHKPKVRPIYAGWEFYLWTNPSPDDLTVWDDLVYREQDRDNDAKQTPEERRAQTSQRYHIISKFLQGWNFQKADDTPWEQPTLDPDVLGRLPSEVTNQIVLAFVRYTVQGRTPPN